MHLKKLELSNFCQHEKRVDELSPGLIGVVGPNGSGKSNWTKAIFRALTGRSANEGTNAEDLTWGAKKGFVKLTFTVNQTEGTIKRDLKTSRVSLKFGDSVSENKAKLVEDKLSSILGTSGQVLKHAVFAPQKQIEEVVTQKPAERNKSLQALFGTAEAERLRQLLSDELTQYHGESRQDLIQETKAKLAELQVDLTRQQQRLEDLKAQQPSEDAVEQARSLISAHAQYVKTKSRLDTLQTEIQELQDQRDTLKRQLSELQCKQQESQELFNQLEPAIGKIGQKLTDHDEAVRVQTRRQHLEQVIVEGRKTIAESPQEEVPEDRTSELQEKRTRLSLLQHERSEGEDVVEAFGSTGSSECPTCHQQVDATFVETCRKRLVQLGNEISELESEIQFMVGEDEKAKQAYEDSRTRVIRAQTRVEQAEQELTKLPQAQPLPEEDAQILRSTVQDYEQTKRELSQVTSQCTLIEERLKNASTTLSDKQQQRENMLSDIGTAADVSKVDAAKTLLEQLQKVSQDISMLRGAISQLTSSKEGYEKQLKRLEEHEQELALVNKYRSFCDRGRTLLHRDNLPRIVACKYLRALNQQLSRYLDVFEVPFTARMDEELKLMCKFGEYEESALRLSGGQRLALGLAWRFAVYSLFSGELGFMVLDEPTTDMDPERIEGLYNLLEKIKDYSHNAGTQIIIVTHERRLFPVFDKLITLEA